MIVATDLEALMERKKNGFMLGVRALIVGLVAGVAVGCQTHTGALQRVEDVQPGRDKRSAADEIADRKLMDAVTAAFAADAQLAGATAQVDSYRQVVTLKGLVANPDIERRMIKVANGVAGVTVVVSRLKVAPGN